MKYTQQGAGRQVRKDFSVRETSDNYPCRRWGRAIPTATICNGPQGISWRLIRSDLPHNPAGVLAGISVVLRQAEHTEPAPQLYQKEGFDHVRGMEQ